MHNDDDKPVPRGLLFILDDAEGLCVARDGKPGELDSLRFEKRICDLYAEGRCILPRTKWVN